MATLEDESRAIPYKPPVVAPGHTTASVTDKISEVVPACAQACPTDAIVFGDQKDRKSRVNIFKAEPRNYSLLAELNT
ncbi:MAG TPA: hypothetical protein VLX28_02495, partial [Thermoanaerobaculia bacterium]|nr:hypothetical protein [Thermoanaerobaculia bacterium]